MSSKTKRIRIGGKEAVKINIKMNVPDFKEPLKMESVITGPKEVIEEIGEN